MKERSKQPIKYSEILSRAGGGTSPMKPGNRRSLIAAVLILAESPGK